MIEYKENNKYAYFNNNKFTRDDKTGYYLSSLINGKRYRLHRYVWEYYNGTIPKGYDIHHKDHNKLNNHYTNLEGLTNSEHVRKHEFGKDSKGGNRPSKYKSFTLITPTNLKFDYTDVNKAALEHDLNIVGLLNILSKHRDSYKGYRVDNVVTR